MMPLPLPDPATPDGAALQPDERPPSGATAAPEPPVPARSMRYTVPPVEVQISAVRAQGAGGQNVNKVSNSVHLRFDIHASAMPAVLKARLAAWPDQRIGRDGVVVIKAQAHRSLPMNRAEAMERLQALVDLAGHVDKPRRATRPTRASQRRRVEGKVARGQIKAGRGRVHE